jgi:hypothetical protein
MKSLILIAICVLSCSSVMSAQTRVSQVVDDEDEAPAVEGFVGFSRLQTISGGSTGFNGFNTSVTANVSSVAGVKFDLSGHFREGISIYSFQGGGQLKANGNGRYKPFVHALAGGARISSSFGGFSDGETGFAATLGGGLDVKASQRIDIRVLQIDYVPLRFSGFTTHSMRFGAGIVFH